MYPPLSLWWVGEVEVCGGCMCCVTPIASKSYHSTGLCRTFKQCVGITCDLPAQYHIGGGGGDTGNFHSRQ